MIEVICTSVEDAINVEIAGANRIELISAFSEGGLTPSYGMIQAVVESVKLPVNVMIRPHSNSFTYTEHEIELMCEDIKVAKKLGANGVVFGVLDVEGRIHTQHLGRLLDAAKGLEVTFHRAIDAAADTLEATRSLCEHQGIHRVLSSGGPGKAMDNIEMLVQMKQLLDQSRIILLAGSGIKEGNIQTLHKSICAEEYHVGTGVREAFSITKIVDVNKLKSFMQCYNQ